MIPKSGNRFSGKIMPKGKYAIRLIQRGWINSEINRLARLRNLPAPDQPCDRKEA
jgi:hypothetical protein